MPETPDDPGVDFDANQQLSSKGLGVVLFVILAFFLSVALWVALIVLIL